MVAGQTHYPKTLRSLSPQSHLGKGCLGVEDLREFLRSNEIQSSYQDGNVGGDKFTFYAGKMWKMREWIRRWCNIWNIGNASAFGIQDCREKERKKEKGRVEIEHRTVSYLLARYLETVVDSKKNLTGKTAGILENAKNYQNLKYK